MEKGSELMAPNTLEPEKLNLTDTPRLTLPDKFRRFHKLYIAEHLGVLILFTGLVITGLPQKFFDNSWSNWIIQTIGGIDRTRWIHRTLGVLFSLLAISHLGRVSILLWLRKIKASIWPTIQDFHDVVLTLRYYLGISEEHAKFDRYDFRQKFEYLGMVIGGLIMIATGIILMYPVFFTKFLPGVIIPAAKTAHSYESIIIWHMYSAHLSPDVFPADLSIFTGNISRERMEKEHPLEYERLVNSLEQNLEQKDEKVGVV
jgi:formate dehydrogenase subunit gamma